MAVLDDGIIVFANHAFASRLGYDSPEDIESTPLLDLISGLTKQAFKDYLAQAKRVEKYAKHTPEAQINLKRKNGTEKKHSSMRTLSA